MAVGAPPSTKYDVRFQISPEDWTRDLSTELDGDISLTDTTIDLVDSLHFDAHNGAIVIDDEIITYLANSANQMVSCTRGAHGTGAAIHESGTLVEQIHPEPIVGFKIVRDTSGVPTAEQASSLPSQPATQAPLVDVEAIYDSSRGGIGWSRRGIDDVVAYGAPAWLKSWRGIGPTPKFEWLNLPVTNGSFRDDCAFVSFETGDPPEQRSPYFLFGQYVLKHPAAEGSSLVVSKDWGAAFNATSWAGAYGGPAWIGGTGATIKRLEGTWTESPSITSPFLALTNLTIGAQLVGDGGDKGVPKDILIAAETDNTSFKITRGDPMHGPYTPGQPVYTGSAAPIRKFISAPQAFGIIKRDGVWMHDGMRVRHLTPWWKHDEDYDAGWAALFWHGFVAVAHPRYLVLVPWTTDANAAPWFCQPGAPPQPNRTPIDGPIYALADVYGWLYAAVYNEEEDQSYICSGMLRDVAGIEGISPVVWYGAEQIVPGCVKVLKPVRVQTHAEVGRTFQGPPWLYVGTYIHDTSGTGEVVQRFLGTHDIGWHLGRYRLASGGGDIYNDPTIEYQETWRCVFPREDFQRENAATKKMVRAYSTAHEGPVDGLSGLKTYAAVGDGPFIYQGETAAPGDTFLADEFLTGNTVTVMTEGRGTPTEPTLQTAIRVHATLIPATVDRQVLLLDLGPAGEGEDSPTSLTTPKVALEYLHLLEQSGAVVMWDYSGQWLVKILPGVRRVPIAKPTDDGWRLYARVNVDFIEEHWRWTDSGPLSGGTW